MPERPRYLLLIACSQRKRPDPGLLRAIERYDGGQFRVLRKVQREGNWPFDLDILILSAQCGLIEASAEIANYDRRMNRQRASELNAQTLQVLEITLAHRQYNELYVDLGEDYKSAIEGIAVIPNCPPIVYAQGRIGERLRQLRQWLITKEA